MLVSRIRVGLGFGRGGLISRGRESRELELKRLLNLPRVRLAKAVFGGKRAACPLRGFIVLTKLAHFAEELIAQHR